MSGEHIATYLKDHLAGSVAALELLAHLEADHAGTPLDSALVELRVEIEADRKELDPRPTGRMRGSVSEAAG